MMSRAEEADDAQQERIVALVDNINATLAGLPVEEAHTALTVAVVAGICAVEGDESS
jgi:hypothetical protein